MDKEHLNDKSFSALLGAKSVDGLDPFGRSEIPRFSFNVLVATEHILAATGNLLQDKTMMIPIKSSCFVLL